MKNFLDHHKQTTMPFLVPGRGFQPYDNTGNYWGYFPNGRTPECDTLPNASGVLRGCPRGNSRTGFQRISKLNAPWCSCNMYSKVPRTPC